MLKCFKKLIFCFYVFFGMFFIIFVDVLVEKRKTTFFVKTVFPMLWTHETSLKTVCSKMKRSHYRPENVFSLFWKTRKRTVDTTPNDSFLHKKLVFSEKGDGIVSKSRFALGTNTFHLQKKHGIHHKVGSLKGFVRSRVTHCCILRGYGRSNSAQLRIGLQIIELRVLSFFHEL